MALGLLVASAIVAAGCTPSAGRVAVPLNTTGDSSDRTASCAEATEATTARRQLTERKPQSNTIVSRWLEQCRETDGVVDGNPFCAGAGDPWPIHPVTDPLCPRNVKDEIRWLSARPVVPFARVRDGQLATAGPACCVSWWRRDEAWLAVDRWGQPIRKHTVTSGDGYDVTECIEMILEPEPRKAVLFVSTGHEPGPSFEWKPTKAQKTALRETLSTYHRVLVEEGRVAEATKVGAASAQFFTMDANWECKMLGYAAVGGLSTTIWQLPEGGPWSLVYQRAPTSFDSRDWGRSTLGTTSGTLFNPIAVLDMDGSGIPEVVVRYDARFSYSDFALRFNGSYWEEGAEGVGGATL